MDVGAHHLTVLAHGPVGPRLEGHQRTCEGRARGDAMMDLVAVHRGTAIAEAEPPAHLTQLLGGLEGRLEVEETEAGRGARGPLDAVGIVNEPSEHLVTATDAHHQATVAEVPREVALEARLTEV